MGACRARTQQLWPTNHPQHSRETWMHASDARNSPTQLQTGHSQPACKATHLEPANSLRLPVVQIQTTLLISPRSSARHQGTRNIPFCLQATLSNHTHNGRYQFNKNFGNNSNNYPNPSSSTKWINYNLLLFPTSSSEQIQSLQFTDMQLPQFRNKDDNMTDLSLFMYKWKCQTSSYFPRTLLLKAATCVFSIQGTSLYKASLKEK